MSNGLLKYTGVPGAIVASVALLAIIAGASIPFAREVFAPGSDDPPYANIMRVESLEAVIVRGNILGAWRACREALMKNDMGSVYDAAAQISVLQEDYQRLTKLKYPLGPCP